MSEPMIPPIHPGEILLEEYLLPLRISQNQLCRDLGVSAQRINEIIKGERSITLDTALRLAIYFETSPQFWLNLQNHFDEEMAIETGMIERIKREVRSREPFLKRERKMDCHTDTQAAAMAVIAQKGMNEFTIPEVLKEMGRQGTLNRYQESTIRTHITSRCCENAPDHHGVTYRYFRRVRRGVYEVI